MGWLAFEMPQPFPNPITKRKWTAMALNYAQWVTRKIEFKRSASSRRSLSESYIEDNTGDPRAWQPIDGQLSGCQMIDLAYLKSHFV